MFDRLVREQQGFSLIEILIAMLIIGSLAAIAIPSFAAQRSKAQDTCAKTQLRTMQLAMENIYTDTDSYEGIDIERLHQAEPAAVGSGACGEGSTAAVGALAGTACDAVAGTGEHSFCLSQSSASGRNFVLARSEEGTIKRVCAPAGDSCHAGNW